MRFRRRSNGLRARSVSNRSSSAFFVVPILNLFQSQLIHEFLDFVVQLAICEIAVLDRSVIGAGNFVPLLPCAKLFRDLLLNPSYALQQPRVRFKLDSLPLNPPDEQP